MLDPKNLRIFLRSILASALSFGLDFLVCLALVSGLGWNYLPATCLSFATATVLNYFLSSRWAFRRRNREASLTEFVVFLGISALGLGLNGGAMYLLAGLAGLNYLWARIIAASAVFFFNYFCRKVLIFALPGDRLQGLLGRNPEDKAQASSKSVSA